MAEEQSQDNIKQELNSANIGLNLDNTLNQINGNFKFIFSFFLTHFTYV